LYEVQGGIPHALLSTACVMLVVLTLCWREEVMQSNMWSDGTQA